ncbi:MAG: hypothetical protein E2590_07355 [Chryseobacterium sp.]|nr:hypothetical protein [Chryseobacterium sp.]
MFGLFSKKYWYHFYLPAEVIYHLSEVNNSELKAFLTNENIKFSRIDIQKISDYLGYVSISFKTNNELSYFKKYISKFKELIPPWSAFPNLFQGAPRWNQGYEEDYCIKNWVPYWRSLNALQKQQYMAKFNCPIEWKEWFKENKMLD